MSFIGNTNTGGRSLCRVRNDSVWVNSSTFVRNEPQDSARRRLLEHYYGSGERMASQDALLSLALSFSPQPTSRTPLTDAEYDRQIKSLVHSMNQVDRATLLSCVIGGGDILVILDPSVNTIPCLYILNVRLENPRVYDTLPPPLPTLFPRRLIVHGPLWAKIEEFMQQFDVVQIRYAGHEMKKLIDKVASVARSSSNLRSAISPIRSAILRLDPSGACLTSIHLLFVRLCLDARACEDALPVVEKQIHRIAAISDKGISYDAPRYLCQTHPSSATIFSKASGLSNALDCKDILKYFLHTGMIFMGLKKWEEAIKFLDMVIAHPTSGNASMIQIQAYKKRILAAILEHGHAIPLPSSTNSQAAKIYKSTSRAYISLADVFARDINDRVGVERLTSEVHAGMYIWEEDSNKDLVMQVIEAFRLFSLKTLWATYHKVDIMTITCMTPGFVRGSVLETAEYIQGLIDTGKLKATLLKPSEDARSWELSNDEGLEDFPEALRLEQVVEQTQNIKELAKHVRENDRKMSLSKEFVDWTKKTNKSKEMAENSEFIPFVPSEYTADEDMMADV